MQLSPSPEFGPGYSRVAEPTPCSHQLPACASLPPAELTATDVHLRLRLHDGLRLVVHRSAWQEHCGRRAYLAGMERLIAETLAQPDLVTLSTRGRKRLYYRYGPWRGQSAYLRVVVKMVGPGAGTHAIWLSAYWCDGPQAQRERLLYRSGACRASRAAAPAQVPTV